MLLKGRFYRVPDDTPHYPGFHPFISRDWADHEQRGDLPLGEQEGARTFSQGAPPNPAPKPRRVGKAEAFSLPDIFGFALNEDDTGAEQWHPAPCYDPLIGPDTCLSIVTRPDVALLATAMYATWTGPHIARAIMLSYLGGYDVDPWQNGVDAPLTSVSLIFRAGTRAVIFIDGTRGADQGTGQALSWAAGPRDFGGYDASRFYELNAREMMSRLSAADCGPCTDWLIVGHSYGGATAAVVAAKLRIQRPNDKIALLTFAAPRAGGQRLLDVLKRVCQRHYVGVGDVVPLLPPQFAWFSDAFNSFTFLQWLTFDLFRPFEQRYLIDTTTFRELTRTEDQLVSVEAASMSGLNNYYLNPAFEPHFMVTYANYLRAQSGLPPL